MKTAVIISGAFAGLVACATGTVSTSESSIGDSGISFKGDAAPSAHDSGSQQPDTGTNQTCTGGQTLCGSLCVDTSSNPNNCGSCNFPCDSSSTCTAGQCVPTQQNTNEPPQGTCSHSLCSTGNYLDEGCDTQQCTVVICDIQYLGDDFCCDTDWDATCIDEVNTYCAPYSCQ